MQSQVKEEHTKYRRLKDMYERQTTEKQNIESNFKSTLQKLENKIAEINRMNGDTFEELSLYRD